MADIPRYKPDSPRFRPVTETGQAQAWGSLAQRMEDWSARFADLGVQQARQEGAQQGAQEGAQPGKPDIPDEPTINVRENARRDAALLAHKARIQSDIRNRAAMLEAEHQMDPEGFQAAMEGYGEGLMSEVHDQAKPDVQLLLEDYGGRAFTRINTRLADQAFKDDVLEIENQVTSLSEEALTYARDNDEAGLYKAKARLQSLQAQAVKSNIMTPAQVEAQLVALDDAILVESAVGEFSRTLYGEGIEEAEEVHRNFQTADLKSLGMDAAMRDKIEGKMRALISQEQARINREAAREKAASDATVKALREETKDMAYLLENGRLDERAEGRLEQLLELTAGTELHSTLTDALTTYDAVDKFNRLSVAEQEAYLDQLQEFEDADSLRLAEKLEKVATERRRALEDGKGLDLYYSDGYAPAPAPLDFGDEDSLRAGLALRNEQAQQASSLYQYRVSPLRDGEISMLTEYVAEASAPEKMRLLGIMSGELGGNFLPAMRDIDKKGGTTLAMAGGLMSTTGQEPARLLLRGAEIMQEAPELMPQGTEKSIMDADMSEQLGPLFLANPRHRGAMNQAIRGIYAGLSAKEGAVKGEYDASRLETAITLATGGVHRWEGSRWGAKESVITPPVIGWDEDMTKEWLDEKLSPEDIDALGGVAGFSSEEFLKLFRRDGVLVPVGMTSDQGRPARTRYLVFFGDKPVKSGEGKPFILEYRHDL
jgi:hypothetical protein